MSVNAMKSFNHSFLLFLPLEKEKEYLEGYAFSIPLFSIVKTCYIIDTKTVDGLPYLSTWSHSAINNLIGYLLFLSFTPGLRLKISIQPATVYKKHNFSKNNNA